MKRDKTEKKKHMKRRDRALKKKTQSCELKSQSFSLTLMNKTEDLEQFFKNAKKKTHRNICNKGHGKRRLYHPTGVTWHTTW